MGGRWDATVATELRLDSTKSLIDYDTVVYSLDIASVGRCENLTKQPNGIPKALAHWRREMTDVLRRGGTVFVICGESFNVEATKETGKRAVSSYTYLPVPMEVKTRRGDVVRATQSSRAHPLRNYARIFRYVTVLQTKLDSPLFETRGGEHCVGGITKVGEGYVVFLPIPELLGKVTQAARAAVSGNFFESLADFAAELRRPAEEQAPEWVAQAYQPARKLVALSGEIKTANDQIEQLQTRIATISAERKALHKYELLLFGKGDELEETVRSALALIGFNVEKYDNGDLRFDLVGTAEEGRFLGEVEGKDNSHLDVTKIRQLSGNIDEDFNREDVSEPAHGVLFGNAFRRMPLEERRDFFTAKVMATAARRKIALVRTPDLMPVVQAVLDGAPAEFTAACRRSLFTPHGGIVSFPDTSSVR